MRYHQRLPLGLETHSSAVQLTLLLYSITTLLVSGQASQQDKLVLLQQTSRINFNHIRGSSASPSSKCTVVLLHFTHPHRNAGRRGQGNRSRILPLSKAIPQPLSPHVEYNKKKKKEKKTHLHIYTVTDQSPIPFNVQKQADSEHDTSTRPIRKRNAYTQLYGRSSDHTWYRVRYTFNLSRRAHIVLCAQLVIEKAQKKAALFAYLQRIAYKLQRK